MIFTSLSYCIIILIFLTHHIGMCFYYKHYSYWKQYYSDLGYNHPKNCYCRKIIFMGSLIILGLSLFIPFSFLQCVFISLACAGLFHYNKERKVESFIHGFSFICVIIFIAFGLAFHYYFYQLGFWVGGFILFLIILIKLRLKVSYQSYRKIECPIQKILLLYMFYLLWILV